MTDTLKIICDQCKQEVSSIQSTKKALKRGFFEIGFTCPHCDFWVHSHYTNSKLDLAERILSNFKDASTKSLAHRLKYEKKIVEYLGQHERVQRDAKKALKAA